MSELGNQLSENFLTSMSPLITIFKAVGIILLIYLIFLIIRAAFRWRTSFRIGRISKNVEQINKKLDILVKRTKPAKGEKKKKGK